MDSLLLAYILVHSITALVSLGLFGFYILLYSRTRISLMVLMANLVIIYGITNFILVIAEVIPRKIGYSTSIAGIELAAGWTIYDILGVVSAFGIGVVLVLGLIFFDSFKGVYSLPSMSFAIGTLTGLVVAVIATFLSSPKIVTDTAFINNQTVVFVWSPLIWLLLGVLSLFNGVVISKNLYRILKLSQEPKRTKQIRFMLVGTILGFIVGPVVSAAGDNLSSATGDQILGAWVAEILGYGIISLGIILVSVGYILHDEISLLRPQQIDRLLVLLDSGVVVYEYELRRNRDKETGTTLLGSALTAIKSIMHEALGAENLVSIQFKDTIILVRVIPSAAIILVAEQNNLFLQKTLHTFAEYIQDTFSTTIAKFKGEPLDPIILDPKVRQIFGLPTK